MDFPAEPGEGSGPASRAGEGEGEGEAARAILAFGRAGLSELEPSDADETSAESEKRRFARMPLSLVSSSCFLWSVGLCFWSEFFFTSKQWVRCGVWQGVLLDGIHIVDFTSEILGRYIRLVEFYGWSINTYIKPQRRPTPFIAQNQTKNAQNRIQKTHLEPPGTTRIW